MQPKPKASPRSVRKDTALQLKASRGSLSENPSQVPNVWLAILPVSWASPTTTRRQIDLVSSRETERSSAWRSLLVKLCVALNPNLKPKRFVVAPVAFKVGGVRHDTAKLKEIIVSWIELTLQGAVRFSCRKAWFLPFSSQVLARGFYMEGKSNLYCKTVIAPSPTLIPYSFVVPNRV